MSLDSFAQEVRAAFARLHAEIAELRPGREEGEP